MKSNQYIHLPYSSIRLWAEEVEQGSCTVETPPYHRQRFKSPNLSHSKSKILNGISSIQAGHNTKHNTPSVPVPGSQAHSCFCFWYSTGYTRSSIRPQHSDKCDVSFPLTQQSDLKSQLCDASSPPTNDGTSIDNLSIYIRWLQG